MRRRGRVVLTSSVSLPATTTAPRSRLNPPYTTTTRSSPRPHRVLTYLPPHATMTTPCSRLVTTTTRPCRVLTHLPPHATTTTVHRPRLALTHVVHSSARDDDGASLSPHSSMTTLPPSRLALSHIIRPSARDDDGASLSPRPPIYDDDDAASPSPSSRPHSSLHM
jgi:hypothetical protein